MRLVGPRRKGLKRGYDWKVGRSGNGRFRGGRCFLFDLLRLLFYVALSFFFLLFLRLRRGPGSIGIFWTFPAGPECRRGKSRANGGRGIGQGRGEGGSACGAFEGGSRSRLRRCFGRGLDRGRRSTEREMRACVCVCGYCRRTGCGAVVSAGPTARCVRGEQLQAILLLLLLLLASVSPRPRMLLEMTVCRVGNDGARAGSGQAQQPAEQLWGRRRISRRPPSTYNYM